MIKHTKTVLVKGVDNLFYAYYDTFDTIYVHNGDKVEKGSIIGEAAESADKSFLK